MKRFKGILTFLMVVMLLSGCKNNVSIDDNRPINGSDEQQNIEIKAQKLPDKIAGFTEITSYTGDTDADGTDETVVLATSAERDEKGKLLWNDGQNWALYVKDSSVDGCYILLDEYVQTGNVYFEISDYYMKDGAKPFISVIVSTGAGFSVKNYSFSKEKSTYEEETLFDTKNVTEGGINRRYTSIPDIVE